MRNARHVEKKILCVCLNGTSLTFSAKRSVDPDVLGPHDLLMLSLWGWQSFACSIGKN